jgi:Tol biopolymer transport system component
VVAGWAPIVFTSTRDYKGDGIQSHDLYVMEADGSGETRLTANESAEVGASWSSDGESLRFARPAVP